jgi:hypothetical protein
MMYLDRNGQPLEMMEAAKLLQDVEYKRIAWDVLADETQISTVWLGLDHGFGGRPLIFETMVFPPNSSLDLDCERYETEREALIGHAAMVMKWKAKLAASEAPQ